MEGLIKENNASYVWGTFIWEFLTFTQLLKTFLAFHATCLL